MAVATMCVAAAVVRPAAAQPPPAPVALLDVPYLPQSVALCGGAAAAMVMRYWGATAVYAESFADLVIPEEGGIRGADLLGELQRRGWDARSFRGDAALVQRQLAERRPVIALIEDRPGTFHYVVVVAWPGGRVIAHDPARAPFQVYDEDRFNVAWSRSGFWSMLALPPPADPAAPVENPGPGATPTARTPCEAMVDEGVRLAGGGDPAAARRTFAVAAEACPASSAPWRELAGLYVLRQEWSDAEQAARRAVTLEPDDQHAWRIIATSAYLQGNFEDALAAWNAVGEPVIDLVNVRGLDRTRYATALGVLGLEPQTTLRPESLVRARRRLAEMPSVQVSRASYRPAEGGRAVIEAVVIERPLYPASIPVLVATGLRGITHREIGVDFASPSGGGELWSARWSWWRNRPSAQVAFAAPGPGGDLRTVSLFSSKESFATPGNPVGERRSGGIASLSDWTARGTRWELGAGLERWDVRGTGVLITAAAEQRLAGERARLRARTDARFGNVRTVAVAAEAEWRSSPHREGRVWIARSGIEAVGDAAPLSLWPGAGIGQAREPLLRAHPLLDDGVIAQGAFGRTLASAGAEWRQWHPLGRGLLRLAPAAFVDIAHASRTTAPFDDRLHADAGVGLRLGLPGAGNLRVDVARGLRDGHTALSIGWAR